MDAAQATRRRTRIVAAALAAVIAWPAGPLPGAGAPPAEAAFPGGSGRIAFESNLVTANNPTGDFEIFSMNPNGTDVRQLTSNTTDDRFPAWSPDGTKIAFIRNATSLYRMTPDGANQRQILKGPDGPSDVRWSPDGRELVFAGFAANGAPPNEIYTVKANGTSLTNRTNNLAFDLVPDWSPNPSQSAAAAARAKHDRQDAHGKGGKGKHKQDGANARHRHRAGRNGGHLRHQGKDRQNTEATSGQPRTARNRQGQHGQRGK